MKALLAGRYVVTKDTPNPSPDRRSKSFMNAEVWKADTRVKVRSLMRGDELEPHRYVVRRRMRGQIGHQGTGKTHIPGEAPGRDDLANQIPTHDGRETARLADQRQVVEVHRGQHAIHAAPDPQLANQGAGVDALDPGHRHWTEDTRARSSASDSCWAPGRPRGRRSPRPGAGPTRHPRP